MASFCACGRDEWVCQSCGHVYCAALVCERSDKNEPMRSAGRSVCSRCIANVQATRKSPHIVLGHQRSLLPSSQPIPPPRSDDAHERAEQHGTGTVTHHDALRFMLAGNAIVTLRNRTTGNRFTYQVRMPRGGDALRFVALLRGPENTHDYSYIGTIFGVDTSPRFRWTAKARVTPTATSFETFSWVFNTLAVGASLPDTVEIWHEGKCGRCKRLLTTPESVARGIGPECAMIMQAG